MGGERGREGGREGGKEEGEGLGWEGERKQVMKEGSEARKLDQGLGKRMV